MPLPHAVCGPVSRERLAQGRQGAISPSEVGGESLGRRQRCGGPQVGVASVDPDRTSTLSGKHGRSPLALITVPAVLAITR